MGTGDRPLAASESWAIVTFTLVASGPPALWITWTFGGQGHSLISVERSTARAGSPAFPSPTRLGDVAFVSMKRAEAERRMKALVDFHSAVGEVLRLTDFADDGFGRQAVRPKPGREQEWHAAKSKADRLVAAAARSFDAVGASISYKPRGTWDQYPINPASTWETILKDDPMYDASLLDTMTNQAIGAYESLVDDPPKRQRVRIEGFSFPGWVAGVLAGVVATVIGGGILYWLGWVG